MRVDVFCQRHARIGHVSLNADRATMNGLMSSSLISDIRDRLADALQRAGEASRSTGA